MLVGDGSGEGTLTNGEIGLDCDRVWTIWGLVSDGRASMGGLSLATDAEPAWRFNGEGIVWLAMPAAYAKFGMEGLFEGEGSGDREEE